MASDCFMEVSTPSIYGESGDKEWGTPTDYWAFELSSFEFEAGYTPPDDDDDSDDDASPRDASRDTSNKKSDSSNKKSKQQPKKKKRKSQRSRVDNSSAWKDEPLTYCLTIHKAIDFASPDLFQRCCAKKPITWAKIYVRKAGDKNEWLRLEFRKLMVVDFNWTMDPVSSAEEALRRETVKFAFNSVLIKYLQQQTTGQLGPPQEKGWNFEKENAQVIPLRDYEPADSEDQ